MKGEGKGEILNFTDVSVLQKQSECFKVTKEKKFTFFLKFVESFFSP